MKIEEILENDELKQTVEKLRRLADIANRIGDHWRKAVIEYSDTGLEHVYIVEPIEIECNIAVNLSGPVPKVENRKSTVRLHKDMAILISNDYFAPTISLSHISVKDLYILAIYEKHCSLLKRAAEILEDMLKKERETARQLQRLVQIVQKVLNS